MVMNLKPRAPITRTRICNTPLLQDFMDIHHPQNMESALYRTVALRTVPSTYSLSN